MAVEVFINGKPVHLKEGSKMQFNYTIGDILNIASLQVSYSNSFEAPFTAQNILAMDGLGMVGNNSPVPYRKISTNVKYDGFDIVRDGWLDIQETSTSYRMGIREGILDFWKAIENKTIGNDLDISSIDHDKNIGTFVNSIVDSGSLFTYVVADFGGKMQLPDQVITIDYLVPVVKLSYFWNKIFETFGYTYSGSIFSNPDFTDAYITYPKAPDAGEITETLFSSASKNTTVDRTPVLNGSSYEFPASYNWNSSGTGFNWNFTAPHAGTFRLRCRPLGYVLYNTVFNTTATGRYNFKVYKGSQLLKSFGSVINPIDFSDYFFDVELGAGEELRFVIDFDFFISGNTPRTLYLSSLNVEVYETAIGFIDFTDAFSDFAIKDFIKEIVWRYALTPVYDSFNKHITFYTISERVNFNNYRDWTDKYVDRKKEIYIYKEYAQINIFAHKYNDEGDTFRNGLLRIANENLEYSKPIAQSKIHAAEQRMRTYNMGSGSFSSLLYPLWQSELREVVENNQTVQKVEYKGLNGRFYIMKLTQINEQGSFKSEALNTTVHTTPYYFVPNANNTHYSELVAKYYPTYEKILNNFKMHEIELALSLPDILELDFLKLYYFEQEASFYMLNKLTWEEGKTCKGEFIKINK